jgi:hypothetical protein
MADPANNAPPAPANENPPPANTDPNAGQNTPPASGTPPANTATPPASDPKPQETPPNTDPKPQEPQPQNDPPPAPDILDLAKGEEQKTQEAAEKAKADFDAYVKAAGLEQGITDLVVRKGENGQPDVTMPAQEVGAIFSVLKQTGIPADKAKDMIGMVSALDQFRAQAQAAHDEKVLAGIRADTAKEFGDNLGAAARDMVAGGERLFGADLWKDICTITALVNDKRFVRAMAAYGRSGRNDDGGPAPASGGGRTGRVAFDLASFALGTGSNS